MNRLISAAKKGYIWNAYLITGSHMGTVEAEGMALANALSATPMVLEDTKMESIRSMLELVNIRPDDGQRKVFVLHTDDMSERSQNAILKTLEEPPDYCVFILLSTNLMIPLPTIKSRCVIYHCQQDSEDAIQEELQKEQAISPQLYLHYAFGSKEKAKELLADPTFLENRRRVIGILQGYTKKQVMSISKEEREFVGNYISSILLFLRDVMSSGAPEWFLDQLELIDKFRNLFTTTQIVGMIDIVKGKDVKLHRNTNPSLVWDSMQVGLMEVFHD